MKILLTDTSPLIRKAIEAEFSDENVEVRAEASAGRALMDVVHWHPDLIITSGMLDDISGFDLCMLIKLMPEFASIPTIIISGSDSDEVQKKAALVGADHYVSKDKHIGANVRNAVNMMSRGDMTIEQTGETAGRTPGPVLIVDDSTVMRTIIKNMLKTIGVTCTLEASNGAEALSVMNENDIGLLLTDWNMPDINGLELVKMTRGNQKHADLPIVMVTTESGSTERDTALEAGATDLLAKPFSKEKMLNMIKPFIAYISSE